MMVVYRGGKGLLSPDFHLYVMVGIIFGIAIAVETEVSALDAFGLDDPAMIGFDVCKV